MKRIISGILALTLCAGLMCGCQEVESSSVAEPMSSSSSDSDAVSGSSQQSATSGITEQSDQTAETSSTEEASYLKITMKDWDEMNTDSKYINMESILKYITDSGVKTSLDVVDLVSALDKSGVTSKKKTAYEMALKEIEKNNKES